MPRRVKTKKVRPTKYRFRPQFDEVKFPGLLPEEARTAVRDVLKKTLRPDIIEALLIEADQFLGEYVQDCNRCYPTKRDLQDKVRTIRRRLSMFKSAVTGIPIVSPKVRRFPRVGPSGPKAIEIINNRIYRHLGIHVAGMTKVGRRAYAGGLAFGAIIRELEEAIGFAEQRIIDERTGPTKQDNYNRLLLKLLERWEEFTRIELTTTGVKDWRAFSGKVLPASEAPNAFLCAVIEQAVEHAEKSSTPGADIISKLRPPRSDHLRAALDQKRNYLEEERLAKTTDDASDDERRGMRSTEAAQFEGRKLRWSVPT